MLRRTPHAGFIRADLHGIGPVWELANTAALAGVPVATVYQVEGLGAVSVPSLGRTARVHGPPGSVPTWWLAIDVAASGDRMVWRRIDDGAEVLAMLEALRARVDECCSGDPAGGGSSGSRVRTYLHTQATPAAEWTIEHALREPAIVVLDSDGNECTAKVRHVADGRAVVTLADAYAGRARCVGEALDGQGGDVRTRELAQPAAALEWTIEHGLREPVIVLLDADGNEMTAHVRHGDGRAFARFGEPVSGRARCVGEPV